MQSIREINIGRFYGNSQVFQTEVNRGQVVIYSPQDLKIEDYMVRGPRVEIPYSSVLLSELQNSLATKMFELYFGDIPTARRNPDFDFQQEEASRQAEEMITYTLSQQGSMSRVESKIIVEHESITGEVRTFLPQDFAEVVNSTTRTELNDPPFTLRDWNLFKEVIRHEYKNALSRRTDNIVGLLLEEYDAPLEWQGKHFVEFRMFEEYVQYGLENGLFKNEPEEKEKNVAVRMATRMHNHVWDRLFGQRGYLLFRGKQIESPHPFFHYLKIEAIPEFLQTKKVELQQGLGTKRTGKLPLYLEALEKFAQDFGFFSQNF